MAKVVLSGWASVTTKFKALQWYLLVLIKMEVFFILENRSLLQTSFVSGVKAQHTARKSDCCASSSKGTRTRRRT